MVPARPNWFDQVKKGTTLTYSTGEKLAIKKGRRGKWYYKNGTVALGYYCEREDESEEKQISKKRYVIYSHEEDPEEPQAVLACFDNLGNGVVYDMNGKERLKYNQTEGQLIDPKVGLPGSWKWHSLNEPPDLKHGFVDTNLKHPSLKLEKMMNIPPLEDTNKFLEDPMVSIELRNIEREERAAEKMKYKPNKMKMKAVRINEYFSFRLFEQANIHVTFKDGDKHLKTNLGLLLLSNTIIGINLVEASDVVIPFTYIPVPPAKTDSSKTIIHKKKRVRLDVGRARN